LLELLREGRVQCNDRPRNLDSCSIDGSSDEVGAVLGIVLSKLEERGRAGDNCILRVGCA
jgi:hypothetical protein